MLSRAKILNSLVILLIFAGLSGFASITYAATPAGKVRAVSGGVSASGSAGTRKLKTGSPIYRGDKITTGLFGQVQIVFADKTKIAIGASSSMVINRFVLASKSRARAFAVTAARGTFRFISGRSSKRAYKIKTPVATIGIRGTKFDISVRRSSRTSVLHYRGRVRVCGAGSCRTLSRSCEVAVAQRGRGTTKTSSAALSRQSLGYQFPYALNQGRLKPEFRVSNSCTRGNKAKRFDKNGADKGDRQGKAGKQGGAANAGSSDNQGSNADTGTDADNGNTGTDADNGNTGTDA